MEPTSPKGKDLRRDPRFALHCAVEDWEGGGGEFLIHGQAQLIIDPETRAAFDSHARVITTQYPDGTPAHERWSSD